MKKYTCIECGRGAEELYRDFGGGNLKISHCDQCEQVVDKYVEFDPVLVLLDALLHKPQAYRHILLNSDIQFHWRLSVICLLCDAYIKWAQLKSADTTDSQQHQLGFYALEWDFYLMFLLATVELAVFLGCCMLLLWVSREVLFPDVSFSSVVRALLLSSFGKLLVIPAVIWGETNSTVYLGLTRMFVFTCNSLAMRVTLGTRQDVSCGLVAVCLLVQYLTSLSLHNLLYSPT
ncbi:protein ARV1-like isoform X2 [Branchiostoma floridae]|uniref:Protein ARV n=1 Tax=Branchiostoma floridae TaxID=7739 RepID=A0A9J7N510_BRAFL|nr:protein ARV1-like isoform X2 [Branchiostoma floridae]